jgi:serine/threonine protein kinase
LNNFVRINPNFSKKHFIDSNPIVDVAEAFLMIGKTLAHYEITSQIGAGGMGEVYQAKDTKLGREVAIKILPEEFAKDADRVARFQREAKLLASLNHPNIAAIYGLEESDGTNFLVMELVEGQTLDDRIKSGHIPVEDALKLALQISEALEAAHEKGVIHRDLKPANIKVTPDGKVKVLDFGLAKAFAGEQEQMNLSNSPTLSDMATQQGLILGTAAYMSPEQARGKEVDKRADIWAFGVVLFEMLTGKQVFTGDTVSDILASVLAREPEWQSLPANLHPRIRLLLERSLKKDPKNRYHNIADARVDIQEVLADPSGVFIQPVMVAEDQTRQRTILPWALAIIGIIIVGAATWILKPALPPEPKQVIRIPFELPEDQRLSQSLDPFHISPDGKYIVYSTQNKGLYLKPIDKFKAKPIPGSDKITESPVFSPDGKWIVYASINDQKLKKISIEGGAPSDLCEIGPIRGISWFEDNYIVFSTTDGRITKVSSKGGDPETLFELQSRIPYYPTVLPDENLLIYTNSTSSWRDPMITAKPLDSEEPIELFPGFFIRYSPSGHMIYLDTEWNLCAVPFDLDGLKEVGDHVPIIPAIDTVAISDSGTIIYTLLRSQEEAPRRTLVWVDMQGNEKPLEAEAYNYYSLKISRNCLAPLARGRANRQ